MKIQTFPLGAMQANCYLLESEKAVIVIDPGIYNDAVCSFLKKNSSKQRLIILTHGHFDHIGGAERLREETSTRIAIGTDDAGYLSDGFLNLSDMFGAPIAPFKADILFKSGDIREIGDISLNVYSAPGHTPGGICVLANDCLFTGDILFKDSVGRVDFPGGDPILMKKSLSMLMDTFSDDTNVYSGHGEHTTIGREKRYNPFLR